MHRVQFGIAICDGLAYGTRDNLASQVDGMVNNGWDAAKAAHYVRTAALYLCPAQLPKVR